jgi:hypothetical protein
MKRLIMIFGLATVVLAVLALVLVDTIPPRSLTVTHMTILKRRVLQFAHSRGELPHSLTDLPELRGFHDRIRDGWGRDIEFDVSASGVVTFRSLGRDGIVGGSGEDADMLASFPSHDERGKWSDETVQWSHNPF